MRGYKRAVLEARMHPEVTVGCRALDVEDGIQGVRVPTWVLYPARAPERLEHFGPYPLSVATDAPVEGERLPLVVLSHGTGGSPWTYRGLATHLARAGFVVALLEHPGNHRSDNRLAGTAENLVNRPRHVSRVIDGVLQQAPLRGRVSSEAVGVIGHSLGGYTALAVAGGHPSTLPNEQPDGKPHPIPVVRDPRVRALVLLAPAVPWFMAEGALADVDLPILMWTAERDEHTPALHAEIVSRGLPPLRRLTHRVAENAGHFSFQSPFPPALVRPGFAPAQDPEGFDRSAFQPLLHAEILTFLRETLGGP